MKQLIKFVFILFAFPTYSQMVCGEDQQEILDYFSNSTGNFTPNSTYDATTKYVFNVFYHVVWNTEGTSRENQYGWPGLDIGEKKF